MHLAYHVIPEAGTPVSLYFHASFLFYDKKQSWIIRVEGVSIGLMKAKRVRLKKNNMH